MIPICLKIKLKWFPLVKFCVGHLRSLLPFQPNAYFTSHRNTEKFLFWITMHAVRRDCLWLVAGFRYAVSDWSIGFKGGSGGGTSLPSSHLCAPRQHPLTLLLLPAMWLHARWNITLRDKWRILRARHAVRFSKFKRTPRQRPKPFTMTVVLITVLCAVTAVFAMEGKYVDVCLSLTRSVLRVWMVNVSLGFIRED